MRVFLGRRRRHGGRVCVSQVAVVGGRDQAQADVSEPFAPLDRIQGRQDRDAAAIAGPDRGQATRLGPADDATVGQKSRKQKKGGADKFEQTCARTEYLQQEHTKCIESGHAVFPPFLHQSACCGMSFRNQILYFSVVVDSSSTKRQTKSSRNNLRFT